MLAIITGATGGLGRSYVEECAKRGYDLVLSATKQERLEELKLETLKAYPDIKIWAKQCNLGDEASRKEFYDYIKSENLVPNMLINNAGYILEGSVLGCDKEEIECCMQVNVCGTMDMTYWFLKQADRKDKNYLLFVSSMAGYYPMPQMATYSATKAFLTNMSVALRRENKGKNMNVSCVCPGSMATNDAMKRSIKSQGIGGRFSLQSTKKVAKVSVKNVLKNKAIWVPGLFNKFMVLCSKTFSKPIIASVVCNRWTKCEKKRGEYR